MARHFITCCFIFLAGCSSLPSSTLPSLQWQLTGRAVFQDSQQRESASIYWQSAAQQDIIQLSGPFGQGAVRLIADNNGASLWQDGEQKIKSSSLENLLFEQLNWRVPIAEFRHWVRGDTAPGPFNPLIEDENTRQFEQSGWRVTQSKIQSDGLPRKVVIAREPYKLTLLIAKWTK